MTLASNELNDAELAEIDTLLDRVEGGRVPNAEALDGFFAALACCPDFILPSEYLPVIQAGETEDGDLVFESLEETQRFMALVSQHWNHVNHQLTHGEIYLPLILQNDHGDSNGNDWAKGFLAGTHLRHDIWAELIDDEEKGGDIVPIMALAYENHPDPAMRSFKEPIDDEKRTELMVASAAGVMRIHTHFQKQRDAYLPETTAPFVRSGPKIGRNDPCPCGSGKKYKRCCASGPTLH
jgi:uncharacterized protein